MKKNYILLTILFTPNIFSSQRVTTFISPKSIAVNDARERVGISAYSHLPETSFMTSTITTQVSKSFRPERIIQCLFGDAVIEKDNKLTISGSRTTDRKPSRDWLADYFGLAPDFISIMAFRPRVLNFTAQFWSHINCDQLYPGTFLEISVPITHTNWNMNMSENITTLGELGYNAGYFSPTEVERENLLNSFIPFISGQQIPTLESVTFEQLQFGKIDRKKLIKTQFSEVRAYAGISKCACLFSWQAGIVGGIAVGTRPKAEYLFAPIIGNGHHHELGARGAIGSTLWQSCDECERFSISLQATVTHLFSTTQQRSFDLKEKPNSRYMLAQQLTDTISDNLTVNNEQASLQFNNILSSVINFTTFDVKVSIPYQAEFTILCSYTQANKCAWEFGYSFWKRAHDRLTIKNKTNFEKNTWALKGDNQVFGFIQEQPNIDDLPVGTPVALNATQSRATIYSGKNLPQVGISQNENNANEQITLAKTNPRADNPAIAFAGNNQQLISEIGGDPINASAPPIIITFDDINLESAQTTGFVQKIFAHVSKRYESCYDWPEYFVGMGAEVDFASQPGSFDDGANCPFSFWGVWIKGGLVF